MRIKIVRLIASFSVLAATLGAFGYYFAKHPSVQHQLGQISAVTLIELGALYIASIAALAFVTIATLRLCKVTIGTPESLLLTAWSSIINFFGPLQSGPAFRAVYLKRKHGLALAKYSTATLIYYLLYALFSGLFLLSGLLGWWLLLIPVLALIGGRIVQQNSHISRRLATLNLRNWYYLAIATFVQVSIFTLIYYVELKSVMPSVSFSQAVIYTGAANFALFVSITPGAIGFRESFLVFSQNLHHISNTVIVSANIIDRAVYISVLLVVALVILATHGRKYLTQEPPKERLSA